MQPMRHKNSLTFLLAFSTTLMLCFLFYKSPELKSDVGLNSGNKEAAKMNSYLCQRNQCAYCGLQMIFLPATSADQPIAFQYQFDARPFAMEKSSTIVAKLQVFASTGKPIIVRMRNLTIRKNQHSQTSKIFRLPLGPGRYSVNLQLFDTTSEKSLHHHCNFTIQKNLDIHFENIPGFDRWKLFRV